MAVYKYKPGDTPSSIAAQNGITVQQLLAANPGVSQFSAVMGIKLPNIGNVGGRAGNVYRSNWSAWTSPTAINTMPLYGNAALDNERTRAGVNPLLNLGISPGSVKTGTPPVDIG